MIWLDAIKPMRQGIGNCLSLAEEVVSIDESHADAWFAIAQWVLPVDSREAADA